MTAFQYLIPEIEALKQDILTAKAAIPAYIKTSETPFGSPEEKELCKYMNGGYQINEPALQNCPSTLEAVINQINNPNPEAQSALSLATVVYQSFEGQLQQCQEAASKPAQKSFGQKLASIFMPAAIMRREAKRVLKLNAKIEQYSGFAKRAKDIAAKLS